MAATTYECMFLLDTNKVSGDVQAASKQLHTILERNHSEVLASRPWDERRLAYPIRNHKKGLYYLTYFRTEPKNLVNIERDVSLNEMILRSLVIKVPVKLVETLLSLARDEHALALSVAAPDDGTEGAGERGDGDRPRRGGRRFEDKPD
jgi:small subunit ribosomal protein S6